MTSKTKNALTVALTNKALADEVEALLASPAALSDKLANSLEIALADKKAYAEVKAALETGAASLSKRSSDTLAVALASKAASLELFTQE